MSPSRRSRGQFERHAPVGTLEIAAAYPDQCNKRVTFAGIETLDELDQLQPRRPIAGVGQNDGKAVVGRVGIVAFGADVLRQQLTRFRHHETDFVRVDFRHFGFVFTQHLVQLSDGRPTLRTKAAPATTATVVAAKFGAATRRRLGIALGHNRRKAMRGNGEASCVGAEGSLDPPLRRGRIGNYSGR